jgi:pyruvate,water dikinase
MGELKWDPPGPGQWEHDGAHGSTPVSYAIRALFPSAMRDGFQTFTPQYGLPLSHIETRYVNGYPYSSVQMDDLSARAVPPPLAAEQALATKRWRGELAWWREEERPALSTALGRLQAVDLASLDDDALAGHLEECAAVFTRGMTTHFALVGATAIPTGDFLAHCRTWGLPREDCLACLRGDHPLTATRRDVDSLDAFARLVGAWVIGRYDITGRTLGEQPDAIEAAYRATPPPTPSADRLRDKVPPDDRAAFDELLAEARHVFSARDDHAAIGGLWPVGVLRLGLLEAGRRLGIGDDVVGLTVDEVAMALRGARADVDDLARERVHELVEASAATPPSTLGDSWFGAPPELPGALGRVLAAQFTYLDAMIGNARPIGIGTGVARGRAVVAADPEDALDRIQPGDILVTSTTTPAFGAVLPLLAGIVAATGGPLSHTAIVARELGIPAIVGLADALVRISDGVTIEVDAGATEVRIL